MSYLMVIIEWRCLAHCKYGYLTSFIYLSRNVEEVLAVRVQNMDDKATMTTEELRKICALENYLNSTAQRVTDLELMLQLIRVLLNCQNLHENGIKTTDYEKLQTLWGTRLGGEKDKEEKSLGTKLFF